MAKATTNTAPKGRAAEKKEAASQAQAGAAENADASGSGDAAGAADGAKEGDASGGEGGTSDSPAGDGAAEGATLNSTEGGPTEGGANPPIAGDDPNVPRPPDEQHRQTDGKGGVSTVEEEHVGTQAGNPSPTEAGTPGSKNAEVPGLEQAGAADAPEPVVVKVKGQEDVTFSGSKATLHAMLTKGATLAEMEAATGRSSVSGTIQSMARSIGKTITHQDGENGRVFKLAKA